MLTLRNGEQTFLNLLKSLFLSLFFEEWRTLSCICCLFPLLHCFKRREHIKSWLECPVFCHASIYMGLLGKHSTGWCGKWSIAFPIASERLPTNSTNYTSAHSKGPGVLWGNPCSRWVLLPRTCCMMVRDANCQWDHLTHGFSSSENTENSSWHACQ